jgi:tRNA threonylcarbamoyl adenosine modification protein (Sua5/YciO/YrdC/YwlC family)
MQYTLYDNSIDSTIIQKAVDALNDGALIIFPTDSVYSIGCSMLKVKTQEKLAKLKGLKPNQAKFSLLCTDLSQASKFTKPLTSNVFKSIKNNTPGPFTFILDASTEIPKLFNNKRKEIGIRIPDNKITLALIEALGHPLIGTSVHDDDEILEYSTDPSDIYEKWHNEIELLLDGGFGNNKPTTVVNCIDGGIEIIREGLGELK